MGVVSKVFGRFRRRADGTERAPESAPTAQAGGAPDAAGGTPAGEGGHATAAAPDTVDIPKQTAAGEAADNETDEGARQQQ
ncbi:hypothetical protein ACFV5N_24620 [Streptomyces sp. NPDC059853]|uniref:hypothetical protein n=1 Tax=Streptomyces sp. NPDC059853 TaxID=3346973 RepID=UPI00364F44B9